MAAILTETPPSTATFDAERQKLEDEMTVTTKALEAAKDAYREDERRSLTVKMLTLRQEIAFVNEQRGNVESELKRFRENQKTRIDAVKDKYASADVERALKIQKEMRPHLDALAALQQDARRLAAEISATYEEPSATAGTVFNRAWTRACKAAGVPHLLAALTLFDEVFDGKRGTLANWRKSVATQDAATPPPDTRTEAERKVDAARTIVATIPRKERTLLDERVAALVEAEAALTVERALANGARYMR